MSTNKKKLTSDKREFFKGIFEIDDELFDNLEEVFPYNILLSILYYYNEAGSRAFIDIVKDGKKTPKLKEYFEFLDKHNILSIEYVPEAVLFFKKNPTLIDDLLKCATIDDNTIESILYLIEYCSSEKFTLNTVDEISDLRRIRIIANEEYLNSKSLSDVKMAIRRILFGKLPNREILEKNNIQIPTELEALYAIEAEIDNEVDRAKLLERFQSILAISPIITFTELRKLIDKLSEQIWNQELSKPDESNVSYVDGNIPVYTFDGQPFKILAHVTDKIGGANSSNKRINLVSNPEMWDNEIGSTYISTSLISDTHMSLLLPEPSAVIYGFNSIQNSEILKTHVVDAGTSHKNGKKIASETLSTPDYILANSYHGYNEIVLKRLIGNQRVKPDFIICFDGVISEESKLTAQYFGVPIYMIHKEKYDSRNEAKKEMYKNLTFTTFGTDDIDYLLFSRCLYDKKISHEINPRDELQYCLKALNHARDNGIVTYEQYLEYSRHIIDSLIKAGYEKEFINYARMLLAINSDQVEFLDAEKIESIFWASLVGIYSTSNCIRKNGDDVHLNLCCFMDICIAAAKKNLADIDKIIEIANKYIFKNSYKDFMAGSVERMKAFLDEITKIVENKRRS